MQTNPYFKLDLACHQSEGVSPIAYENAKQFLSWIQDMNFNVRIGIGDEGPEGYVVMLLSECPWIDVQADADGTISYFVCHQDTEFFKEFDGNDKNIVNELKNTKSMIESIYQINKDES